MRVKSIYREGGPGYLNVELVIFSFQKPSVGSVVVGNGLTFLRTSSEGQSFCGLRWVFPFNIAAGAKLDEQLTTGFRKAQDRSEVMVQPFTIGFTARAPFLFQSRLVSENYAFCHSSARNVSYGISSHGGISKRSPWVRCGLEGGGVTRRDEEWELPPYQKEISRRNTVAVFWDLDNKPPNSVPPYDAALRLKKLGSELGEVVDMVAYANRNAFIHIPARVREERQDRKLLDQLERRGLVKVEQPYVCTMCGRKCKTNYALKKHFKQLHERERQKRMSYLGALKGKKREKFLEKVSDREVKYKEAARTIIVPKVGYGLATELKRAGVQVRTVESKPQAADEALIKHMSLYINRGLDCLILVSDDSDFLEILRYARSRRLFTVVVGDTYRLRNAADTSFLWEDVASGRARLTARNSLQKWVAEDSLREELEDQYEYEEEEVFFPESEGGHIDDQPEFQYGDEENEEDYDSESDADETYLRHISLSQKELM